MSDQDRVVFTKADIVAAIDRVVEWVPYPESGKPNAGVYVRSISAAERSEIEADAAQYKESKGFGNFARTFTVRMATLAICDEHGAPLFAPKEITLLMQKNAAFVSRCAEKAQELSGFTKADVEALGKDSKPAPADGSPSD